MRVSANSTGAFAALREDVRLTPIDLQGNSVEQDLWAVQPYLQHFPHDEEESPARYSSERSRTTADSKAHPVMPDQQDVPEMFQDDEEDAGIERDITTVNKLCRVLIHDRESRKKLNHGLFDAGNEGRGALAYGADLLIQVGGFTELPAHRVILASRCLALGRIFAGQTIKTSNIVIKLRSPQMQNFSASSSKLVSRISITGCHPLSVIIFLVYLYSDELLAIWDRRIGLVVESSMTTLKTNATQIRSELQALARVLSLSHLSEALMSNGRRSPTQSLAKDMLFLFDSAQIAINSAEQSDVPFAHEPLSSLVAADTILELTDQHVHCHSLVLRARSPFFANFFDDDDWTTKRWRPDRTISVNLKHLNGRIMSYVLRFIYCGEEEKMFDSLGQSCDLRFIV